MSFLTMNHGAQLVFLVVVMTCGGCQSDDIQPVVRSSAISANTVLVRGSEPPSSEATFIIVAANGRHVAPGFLQDGQHFVVLPVGWNRISVEIQDGASATGRMREWAVFLPEGPPLVLSGELHEKSVQVWFEEEETGKRVTDSASVTLVGD